MILLIWFSLETFASLCEARLRLCYQACIIFLIWQKKNESAIFCGLASVSKYFRCAILFFNFNSNYVVESLKHISIISCYVVLKLVIFHSWLTKCFTACSYCCSCFNHSFSLTQQKAVLSKIYSSFLTKFCSPAQHYLVPCDPGKRNY